MKIEVKKLTDISLLQEIVEHCWGITSKASLDKWYTSEHSPVYSQMFMIKGEAPASVCSQLRTHEKNGMQWYSDSGRPDTGAVTDSSRTALRKFAFICNARHIIAMSHKRLCNKAELPTRQFMQLLKTKICMVDSDLAKHMKPKCLYLAGGCNEFTKCSENK